MAFNQKLDLVVGKFLLSSLGTAHSSQILLSLITLIVSLTWFSVLYNFFGLLVKIDQLKQA